MIGIFEASVLIEVEGTSLLLEQLELAVLLVLVKERKATVKDMTVLHK